MRSRKSSTRLTQDSSDSSLPSLPSLQILSLGLLCVDSHKELRETELQALREFDADSILEAMDMEEDKNLERRFQMDIEKLLRANTTHLDCKYVLKATSARSIKAGTL